MTKLIFFCIIFLFCINGYSQKCELLYYDSALQTHVYKHSEIGASFPGGNVKMIEFIRNNFNPPRTSPRLLIQSTIRVNFVVDIYGKLCMIKIHDKSEAELTEFEQEFIRVLSVMPKWEAAICNAHHVAIKVGFTYYIKSN